ncbi:PH domain-containing protein [Streptacidiphilus monticola]|uniref:PH domain-containing protein n=1 Tax=Streptacidiphilus monticola TaxID=2161674 RepID=A0ABW1G6Z7_9ACTN
MNVAERHLAEDEQLVHATRQHWTEIFTEFVLLVLVLAVAGGLFWVIPGDQGWGRIADYVVGGAALIAAVWLWLIPLLKWRSTVYIVTTKRIYVRSGFLTKTGHSIPLGRINDVGFRANLWERMLSEGTLFLESGGEHGMLTLKHVPDPEGLKSVIDRAIDEHEEEHEHRHEREREPRAESGTEREGEPRAEAQA